MPDPLDPDADFFRPPDVPIEVGCLHCQQVYESYLMEWRVVTGEDGSRRGFWCCPTPGCGGAGFLLDIFPTDPDYRDEDGNLVWCHDDSDDEDECDDDFESDGADGADGSGAGESEIPY